MREVDKSQYSELSVRHFIKKKEGKDSNYDLSSFLSYNAESSMMLNWFYVLQRKRAWFVVRGFDMDPTQKEVRVLLLLL